MSKKEAPKLAHPAMIDLEQKTVKITKDACVYFRGHIAIWYEKGSTVIVDVDTASTLVKDLDSAKYVKGKGEKEEAPKVVNEVNAMNGE